MVGGLTGFMRRRPRRTVADLGRLPAALPRLGLPHLPLDWRTLAIVASCALATAVVGLLESIKAAGVVDELTDAAGSCWRGWR